LDGSYTLYNSVGVKKYSGKYLNDIKDGIWKYYKDDKSFDYQIEYINGISQGRQDG
jgi:antitoxin component YwqK of YwqJK toxin-antitoxin module